MIQFTAHNIQLDDGSKTMPTNPLLINQNNDFVAYKRWLNYFYPGDKSSITLADLGCLEGGYATEFAR